MTANYARRRVGRRLTRSSSSKSKQGQDCVDAARPKSPSKSPTASSRSPDDIPVPACSESEDEQQQLPSHSSSASTSSSSLSSSDAPCTAASLESFQSPSQLKHPEAELYQSPTSAQEEPAFTTMYTPSRSTFSSSVSSKRKASNNEIDHSHLRRSVRQRAEASPFRLDSTEAQRDSTLFISQPQTPTRFKNMGVSPTNRKDSLFMSLPASFDGNHSNEAQYAPFLDLSIPSANSIASCFLPVQEQAGQQNTTTPAQEPPFTASYTNLSPAFDLMQYNDLIAPFPMTPQPAFLSFPQTPRFSGTFTIAPQAILGTPSSSTTSFFPVNVRPIQALHSVQPSQQDQQQSPQTPLNFPKGDLPRRARAPSVSSDTGSIIIKELEDDEEEEDNGEEDQGDDTAQPAEADNRKENAEHQGEVEDERFALFASQVRRKAEAMSLKSSQGALTEDSPSKPPRPNNVAGGALPSSSTSDIFEVPNKAGAQDVSDLQSATHVSAPSSLSQMGRADPQQQLFELPPMPTPLPPLPTLTPQYCVENGIYTDQYSSFPLSDEFGMGVSPTKSEKTKRGHHNKDRGGKPPRPPNCFILYRSDKVEEIRAKQQLSKEKMQKDISKLVAELWKQEPQSVKDEYSRRADIAREEHLIKYPGYIYQPARKDKPLDEDSSPLKRSGSARPRSFANDLSKSAPAVRTAHRYAMKEEDEDFTPDEQDERSDSPSPSKAARSRTPLRQSRIPVPKTASKVGSNLSRKSSEDPGHLARTAIPTSTQRPQHSVKRAEAIAHNAGIFATQRGVVQNKVASGIPASTPMSKSRSSPSKTQLADGFSGPQSPSAPRYAQPTAASMSKSMSQPLFGTNYTSRSMPSHPQHQYAAYAHIQHPLPMSPKQNGNASNAFEQMMNSTPSKGQQSAYANISPPDVSLIAPISAEMQNNGTRTQSMAKVSGGRPVHQRSHTSQPALSSGPASTPSRMPSVRRSKTTPQQSSPSNDITSLAIPDGFVISGKLYPAENVEEAMKAYKAATSIGTTQRPATRMASNHSTGSNGPVQELSMPAALPFYGQQQQQQQQQAQPQLQYLSQPAQNYVIGIAPDGQQIPLIISQPQNVPSYTSWQNVPAFMPPSAQATPSTGYTYDFSQPLDTQQNFGFNTLYTPNTANSNMSNMPSSTALWFPQQDSANQGADFSQYLISNESFNNGTSPTFLVNDANGQQQEYVLGGPSVELTSATGFAQLQDPTSWTAA